VFSVYRLMISELKVVSQQKEAEISELKVKIDELKVTAGSEAKAREELQLHYKQRLHEKEAEFDHYRRSDAAIYIEFVFPIFWWKLVDSWLTQETLLCMCVWCLIYLI